MCLGQKLRYSEVFRNVKGFVLILGEFVELEIKVRQKGIEMIVFLSFKKGFSYSDLDVKEIIVF